MAQSDFIEVQVGEGAWLKAARIILLVLAMLHLLTASISPAWKAITISVLLLVFALSCWKAHQIAGIRRLRLYRNGMVTLVQLNGSDIPAVLEGESWLSAQISVLPVGRFDRWPRQHLLVCRSNNHPDAYRQMLRCLRLGTVASISGDGLAGTIRQRPAAPGRNAKLPGSR